MLETLPLISFLLHFISVLHYHTLIPGYRLRIGVNALRIARDVVPVGNYLVLVLQNEVFILKCFRRVLRDEVAISLSGIFITFCSLLIRRGQLGIILNLGGKLL